MHTLNPLASGGAEPSTLPNASHPEASDSRLLQAGPSSIEAIPKGYGRINRDSDGNVVGVELGSDDEVEQNDDGKSGLQDPEIDKKVMTNWVTELGGGKGSGAPIVRCASGFSSHWPFPDLGVFWCATCKWTLHANHGSHVIIVDGLLCGKLHRIRRALMMASGMEFVCLLPTFRLLIFLKKNFTALEELSSASSTAGPRHTSSLETMYLVRLVERYGEEVEKMARDRRLNPEQRTVGELRRGIRRAGGVEALWCRHVPGNGG